METLGKEAVSEWINKLFTKTQDLGAELEKIFGNHNMAEAAKTCKSGVTLNQLRPLGRNCRRNGLKIAFFAISELCAVDQIQRNLPR